MKKTAFHKFVCLLLVCATLLISGSVTLAWLASGTTVRDFPDDFSGSSESAYFAGGDGSPDDPYIIKNAVHLYNLAWLQYLGYFNMRSGFNNGRAQSHFRLDDNITMTGIVLPPIGTMQYPFIGSFNGNGKTVYGLTTSNLETDFGGRYPSTAEFSDAKLLTYCKVGTTADSTVINIVGMFGVVGDYNTWITRNYTSDSAIEIKDYTETTLTNDANILYRAGMSVRSFYISRAKVKTYAAETLVGLAAGFLSAAMKNVGVYYSEIIVGNKNATGVNAMQKADGLDTAYGTKVSLYSLIGDFDSAVVDWGRKQTPTEGGTIDMRTLNRRLTYMYAVGEKNNDASTSSTYHTNLSASVDFYGEYDWKKSTARTMYLGEGTFLPLNVNLSVMGIDTWAPGTEKTENGYTANKYYRDNTTEIISETNTGYIVGDDNLSALNSTITAGIRKLIDKTNFYGYTGIPRSFAAESLPGETINGVTYAAGEYNPFRFAMYTLKKDSNGNFQTYRIIDDQNQINQNNFTTGTATIAGTLSPSDFRRYSTVRKNVDAMLAGATAFHGIRFDSGSSNSVTTSENGTTYTLTDDGKYIKGGINFTVSQKMYITVVMASGYDTNYGHAMFDLYSVKKNTDGTIDATGAVERIEKVYTDDSGNVYYKTNKTDQTTGLNVTLNEAIDLKKLAGEKSNSSTYYLMIESAFYFEIPINPGTYFIGNDTSSSSFGAYIMYLDIGANGNTEQPSDKPYSMEGVNYVDSETVADPANFPEYSRVTFVLESVANATGEYAYVIFYRDSTDGETTDGVIKTKVHYKVDGLTATPTGPDVAEDDTLTEPAYTGN